MSDPAKHTAIISDPISMWSKLAWDADCFRDIQASYPDEREPLAYAAINVCIAAQSLQNWVESSLKREARAAGTPLDYTTFIGDLALAVPEQSACVAIANTSKHSVFNEGKWPNGTVKLVYEDGDEDAPSGYILYHVNADHQHEGFALRRFDFLCQNWWRFLTARGLTNGHSGMPEWRNNKLKRIFQPHLRGQ